MYKETYEKAKEYLIEKTLLSILKAKLQEDRVLVDVPRAELQRIKSMIRGVRIYG